ncbi:uncharacterized protein LOC106179322 [Lingula anatina]|uniref:Uncharacterized protein LOC106179322 n=1 Tax=Lingula anatina TaxID=7574 RepID=A0A1S3K7W3_LINAN|nr:uncharacterized protein LOC106179322 [Lingula anatina]XP_013418351.1 uncharacterized protein LOC106179322 [Lingula anatina]XP_013418352.1 uncharacterized protein LOC106179322 [Lingula anatina]|eukprot:XP_013418350.1 uncharacterized protein LOC106179322 [Lingula anatina]
MLVSKIFQMCTTSVHAHSSIIYPRRHWINNGIHVHFCAVIVIIIILATTVVVDGQDTKVNNLEKTKQYRRLGALCYKTLPLGRYCGQVRDQCCGMMECITYDEETDSWPACPVYALYKECICGPPAGFQHIHRVKPAGEKKYDPCHNRIPQGKPCGKKQDGCCGVMHCLQYNWKPCPRDAAQEDCMCMPKGGGIVALLAKYGNENQAPTTKT